jgi:hypothetical protein
VVWQIFPFFAEIHRNMCRFMNNFPGRHPWTRMKMIHSIAYIAIYITVHTFSFWFKDGAQENYLHKDTHFCRFLLKMGNFAILLPIWSHIFTLELFPTQNLIWIWIVRCLAKRLSEVLSFKLKVLFSPILQGHVMEFWL